MVFARAMACAGYQHPVAQEEVSYVLLDRRLAFSTLRRCLSQSMGVDCPQNEHLADITVIVVAKNMQGRRRTANRHGAVRAMPTERLLSASIVSGIQRQQQVVMAAHARLTIQIAQNALCSTTPSRASPYVLLRRRLFNCAASALRPDGDVNNHQRSPC